MNSSFQFGQIFIIKLLNLLKYLVGFQPSQIVNISDSIKQLYRPKRHPQRGPKRYYIHRIYSQSPQRERTNNLHVPGRQKSKPSPEVIIQDKQDGNSYLWEERDQYHSVWIWKGGDDRNFYFLPTGSGGNPFTKTCE